MGTHLVIRGKEGVPGVGTARVRTRVLGGRAGLEAGRCPDVGSTHTEHIRSRAGVWWEEQGTPR